MTGTGQPMLHCILRDPPRCVPLPGGLRGIAAEGLRALVADVDPELVRTADKDRLYGYADLIGRLHRDAPLIPMRFGCVFASDTAVRNLLTRHQQRLHAMLDHLDDCVEIGIRLILPAPPEPAPTPTASDPPTGGPGRTHLAQIRHRLRSETEAAARGAEARAAIERLGAGRFRDVHQEFGQISGRFLLSLYYLVPRTDAEDFVTALRQDPSAVPANGLITGPWPPFNFVGAIDDEFRSLV
jgi:hypothetical protein